MAMTLEQIKNQLSAIEPNDSTYSGIGSSEIPFLEQLLQDEETWIASRAIFALSRVSDDKVVTILSQAVADPRQQIRVAIAASVGNLKPENASNILLQLLSDNELGVRKFAIQSVSGIHDTAVHEKLKNIEIRDPTLPIREIAKDRLRELDSTGSE